MLVVAGTLLPAPSLGKAKEKDPLIDWANGPVRYLMSRNERKRFLELTTVAERVEFVRQFWSRRDPDRRTPVNEARLEFWRRVTDANHLFGIAGQPGWRSDRGKIYILLGPPDDIDNKENYDVQDRNVAGRGLLRWHYGSGRRQTPRTNFIIAFVRAGDDDWHLSEDPKLSSPYFNVNSPMDEQRSYAGSLIYDQIPFHESSLGTMMDLGRVQEAPPEPDVVRGIVSAEGFVGTFNVEALPLVVMQAAGSPVLALTVAVRSQELMPPWDGSGAGLASRFAVSAQVRRHDATAVEIDAGELSFVSEPVPLADQPRLAFQGLLAIPGLADGGAWDISVVVLDRQGGGAASTRSPLVVPAIAAGAPRLTGPFLANALRRGQDLVPSGRQPFRFGEAIVVPRTGDTYTRAERFALFMEILPPLASPAGDGAAAPAAPAAPTVALDWHFERTPPGVDRSEPWGRPGHLDDARGTRGWELEPGALPPGTYTATFSASLPGAPTIERRITFRIVEGS